MASSYPGGVDAFDTIAADKKTSDAVGGRTHRAMHNDLGDAIEAVQGELGTDPAGSDATVKARLAAIEAGTNLAAGSVTTAKIADGAVGVTQLAADVVPNNLLTANQSSLETDTTGWGVSGNVAITRDTGEFRTGVASLKIASTSDASGTKRVKISPRVAITARLTYTFAASILTDGACSARIAVLWYDAASGGSLVSSDTSYLYITASTGWVDDRMEVTAPAGATHAELNVYLPNAAANGTYVYADRFGVWQGVGGDWAEGGSQITGSVGTAHTKTVYVDTVTGVAGNPGTAALPCATISSAILQAGGHCDTVIKVNAPATAPLRDEVLVNALIGTLRIEPMTEGDVWFLYGSTQYTSGWSAAGGGVYSRAATIETLGGVWVTSLTETVADRTFVLSLAQNTATPTAPGEGEWGWAADVLYVKLPGSASASDHTIEVPAYVGATLTVDDGRCELVSGMLRFHNAVGAYVVDGTLVAQDCVSAYGAASRGTWANNVTGNMELHRCYGWRSANDGFNVHGAGYALLVDCDGSYNYDEGASAHDTATMTVVGGRYAYNVQSGIGSVGSSVNVITGDPQLVGNCRNGTEETGMAGLMIYETSTVQISGVTAQDNNGSGVRIEATATILGGLDGIKSGTVEGNDLADDYAAS